LIPINGLDIPTPVRQTVRAIHRKPETSLIRGDPSQSLPIPHATGEGSGAIPEPQRFRIANGSAGVERFNDRDLNAARNIRAEGLRMPAAG
jgi:hypothetical protein